MHLRWICLWRILFGLRWGLGACIRGEVSARRTGILDAREAMSPLMHRKQR